MKRILTGTLMLLLFLFIFSCAKAPLVPPEMPQPEPEVVQPPVTPPLEAPLWGSVDRYKVGCVLPLSGAYAAEGSKALDAILLSAKIFDQTSQTPWKVIAADSRGVPEGAKEAIAHLVNNENVIAVIAMAGSAEATEAAREAGKWKVPLILITSKEDVTNESDYVFQHFLTPTQQIRALTKYALNNMNCAIFSILYPNDRYGVEMAKIFREEVEMIGGKVEKAVPYGKTQTDFTAEISKVTGNQLIKVDKANLQKKTEPKIPLSIPFEAIFIPDSHLRVKMIASQLAFYDVRGIKLLGTNLWNSKDLLKKGSEYLEGAVFADSFYNVSYYPEVNNFVDDFYTAYGREPEYIEALAYDSAGMIFTILEKDDIKTRRDFASALIQLENYKGATGMTSFDAHRISQKTAFILKVINGKLEQVR